MEEEGAHLQLPSGNCKLGILEKRDLVAHLIVLSTTKSNKVRATFDLIFHTYKNQQ